MKVDNKYWAFTAAALGVIALGVVSLINHVLEDEFDVPCVDRYASYIKFPEEVGFGEDITKDKVDLHFDRDFQGLSVFTKIIHPNEGPLTVAFETRLPKGSNSPRFIEGIRGGMGFSWRPGIPKTATSACLSYHVWLPTDFKFSRGGTLPGLFGGEVPAIGGYEKPNMGFATHVLWDKGGRPWLRTFTAKASSGLGKSSGLKSRSIPLGRWVSISQELILNMPGQNNGAMRVWIDGQLKHEAEDVVFRKSKNLQIAGVLGDVFYGSINARDGAAPNAPDTFMRITPFILNWN